jgi:protein-tyrosine phosphatase
MDRRLFLTAAGALALAPAARAAAPLAAKAQRITPTTVRLDWTGAGAVSVFVSADPNAAKSAMRPLATTTGAATSVAAPVTPRPYFLVRAADGRQARVAERLLPLEGVRNFRDLGGWRAADGRQVKWGKIYRSGVMSGLTMADITYLRMLGVTVICDLRSAQERNAEPNPLIGKADAPKVVATDYDMGDAMRAFARLRTREEAVRAFADAYVDLIDRLAPQYTDMFARLVANEGPLAVNCSAGKDRTGLGSALVLSALGVPRETIIADYALSQTFVPPSYYLGQMGQVFAKTPPAVSRVILGSDPDVMRRALATIDARYGGPLNLIKARFGVTGAKIAALRHAYLG